MVTSQQEDDIDTDVTIEEEPKDKKEEKKETHPQKNDNRDTKTQKNDDDKGDDSKGGKNNTPKKNGDGDNETGAKPELDPDSDKGNKTGIADNDNSGNIGDTGNNGRESPNPASGSTDVYAIVGAFTIVVLSASNNILAKRYRYGRVYVAVGYVILFIMAALVFRVRFKYGLNSFADELALLRTDATGLIQRRFDTGPDPSWAMRRASPFAASLTAAMSYVVAFEGKKTAAVLVAALLIAGLSMSLVEPNIYFAGVMGTLLLTVGVRFLMDNCGQIKYKGVAVNAISAAALFAAAVVAISLIAWQTESSHQGLKEKSETWIHKHRYEKKENPLPEGDLRNLDSFKPTGRVSLTVEMSSPETLYLKGFVGEKFDDGRWEADSEVTEEATEEKDGLKTFTAKFDNEAFETQTTTEVIPKKPHTHQWGEWTKLDDDQHQRVCEKNNEHVEKQKGKLTFDIVAMNTSKYRNNFKIDRNSGTITVIRSTLPKGTYCMRVRVIASGDSAHKPVARATTVSIVIK